MAEKDESIEKNMIGCPCNDGCGQYRNYLNGSNPDDECEGFDYSCIEFDQWAKKKGIYPHNTVPVEPGYALDDADAEDELLTDDEMA